MRRLTTQDLGRHLKGARESKAMAQAQLAEKVGVSIETISRVERGVISPSFVNVARMAAALGVSLDALVGGQHVGQVDTRRAVQRVVGLLGDLDDPTLGALGDFLRGVSTRTKRRPRRPKSDS